VTQNNVTPKIRTEYCGKGLCAGIHLISNENTKYLNARNKSNAT